jgi:hypothetical protein
MAGRPSRLADPEFLRLVAEHFAAGASRQDMCDELGVKDKDTITRWRHDPRVKAIVSKINADRVIQISRKVDSIIEGRLSQADKLDTETLLKIRKEYGGAAVSRKEANDDAVSAEAMKRLEEDPTIGDRLLEALNGPQEAPTEPSAPKPQE